MNDEIIHDEGDFMKLVMSEKNYISKQEILDRIWNVLNQGVDTESGDLDLLRHDLENDVITEQKFNKECG